jgi:preprotein translocase subunit SecB
MISPIQTRRHWINRVVFEPLDNQVANSTYEAHISLKHEKTDGCWRVVLKVEFGGKHPEQAVHNGQIEFEGLFDVHPEFPQDKVEELVRMNGGAILYGAVRELVLNLTARSKFGPFEMPTIDARMFRKPPENTTASETRPAKLKG